MNAILIKALKWYAGMLRPEDRLADNGERAANALAALNTRQPDWVKHEWHADDPRCTCCGVVMFLYEHAEWNEQNTALNLCHGCALDVLEKLVERG